MKKVFVEVMKSGKKGLITKALIIGGIAIGAAIVSKALKSKDGEVTVLDADSIDPDNVVDMADETSEEVSE